MEDFSGVIPYEKEDAKIRVKIVYANKRLSIAGDIYENGRDIGGGQCCEELLKEFPESARLVEIWLRWHLNDLNPGDTIQETYLRALKAMGIKYSSYKANCNALEEVGLLTHEGYKYGSEWKFEAIPDDILNELKEIIKGK